jgi:hypothetical protein
LRRITPGEYLGGKENGMNGAHRSTGILFLSSPTPAGAAHIQDIAPTVLAALGVPAPPMDGTSLLGPVSQGTPADRDSHEPYALDRERVVENRLRALGYFE